MKRNCFAIFVWFLGFWLMALASYGQAKSGLFVYDVISYEIIDSSQTSLDEVTSILDVLSDDFKMEIFYNKTWVVALQKKRESIIKSMYNRKSQVLYTYTDGIDFKRVRIDSIEAIKQKDKDLKTAIDTFKSYMQIVDYPKDVRRIKGITCCRWTVANFLTSETSQDELWVANFEDVPNLVFPDHLYFLIEGIPLEIIQDLEVVKVKWGVVEVKPVIKGDDIFNQEMNGYEISWMDTRKLIFEGIEFVRTFEPQVD